MIEHIESNGRILALILRQEFCEPGVHFVRPPEFSRQLAYIRHPAGLIIKPHIDRSRHMLQEAQGRLANTAPAVREAVVLAEADATTFDLGRRFDAAVSLFHVVSYLSDDVALAATLGTIRRHLYTGAPFVFDFWYGPGVGTEPPRRAERSATNAAGTVRHVSIPNREPERHLGAVRFGIEIDEPGCPSRSVCEDHIMRCCYADEIERELAAAGFALAGMTEWLSDRPPTPSTFSACAVAVAR